MALKQDRSDPADESRAWVWKSCIGESLMQEIRTLDPPKK